MSTPARFLPWTRAAAIAGDSIIVKAAGRDVAVPISRYGPGDVTGIVPGQVRRRDPSPGSLSMPPNLFPCIEFTRPDFPWCMTPGGPDASGRMQPWLALVVVEAAPGRTLASIAGAKQPVLEISRNDLPPSDELALWAHVQVEDGNTVTEDVIRRGIARVMSPRKLDPNTRYLACVVPTFEAGRLAGLGETPADARSAAPAWVPGAGSVVLPVYDHWYFTTTESGDLETLARRLRGRDLAATSRPMQLDVSAVSGDVEGKLAPFEGALGPLGAATPWTGPAVEASANTLRGKLERSEDEGVPVVGSPVYGSTAAGKSRSEPGWMDALNLDPLRRAAAGLGAAIVREHQDELVDEAWLQAGDIERARREREGAVLAEFVSMRLHERAIKPLTGAHALVAMAPALGRMHDTGAPTVEARLASSALPEAAVGPAFRRILATKSPVASRRAGTGLRRMLIVQNAAAISPGALPPRPAKMMTNATVRSAAAPGGAGRVEHIGGTIGAGSSVTSGTLHPRGAVLVPGQPGTTARGAGARGTASGQPVTTMLGAFPMIAVLSTSQRAHLATFASQLATRRPAVVQVPRAKPFAWITPTIPAGAPTATARFAQRVSFAAGARLSPAIGVIATPRFTQALASWLDPAFLMAGVDIPPDTAGLLEVNGAFVEALMIGANHELARELLWRSVPLDRTATLLTRFFDSTSRARDMSAIAEWKATDTLGSHLSFGERVVLVLRSRLVGRLNQTAVFLAKAKKVGNFREPAFTPTTPGERVIHEPVFRGTAGLDTAYFGFELPPEDLTSGDGRYVVIQELAGASRFGFDEEAPETLSFWNDVGWPSVAVAGGYVNVAGRALRPGQANGLVWGRDSAHMASISLQRPIRLAIHTSLLFPEGT